jgi:hypothetical protein
MWIKKTENHYEWIFFDEAEFNDPIEIPRKAETDEYYIIKKYIDKWVIFYKKNSDIDEQPLEANAHISIEINAEPQSMGEVYELPKDYRPCVHCE